MKDHCEDHSGNCTMINAHEKKIDDLYMKWNAMQRWLIGIMVTSLFTLGTLLFQVLTK